MGESTIAILVIIVALFGLVQATKDKRTPEEIEADRKDQEISYNRKLNRLNRINWFISELDRLTLEKSKAIKGSNMELFKKLDEEHVKLNALYATEEGVWNSTLKK